MMKFLKAKATAVIAAALALTVGASGMILHLATPAHAAELSISGASVRTFAGAQAVTNGELVGSEESPVSISVFVTGSTADRYNVHNAKWTHDGTGWTGEDAILWDSQATSQTISACYPYRADVTNGAITVNAAEQVDYLVATATPVTAEDIRLTMTHAMAKLVLTPTWGGEVAEEARVIDKVEVHGMYASGTLHVAGNTWDDLSAPTATLEMEDNELLVIPMAACESFAITVTLENGRVFQTTVSLADNESSLQGGTQYTIALQIGQDGAGLGGITATSWIPVDGGDLATE